MGLLEGVERLSDRVAVDFDGVRRKRELMDVQDVSRLLDCTSEVERGEDLGRKDTISTRSSV